VKGPTKKITVRLSVETVEALQTFQAQYPIRSMNEFVNAAVLYLAEQARGVGLNADLQPIGTMLLVDLMREVVAEEMAANYAKEEKKVRLRLVLV